MTTCIEMKCQKVHNVLKVIESMVEEREDKDEITDESIHFVMIGIVAVDKKNARE